MKFFIVIFLLSIFNPLSYGQQLVITTTADCDDKLYMSLNGRWKREHDYPGSDGFSKADQVATFNRLDSIHKFFFEAYPQPKGLNAIWHRNQIANGFFGQQIEYSKDPDGRLRDDYTKGTAVGIYAYTAGFFLYYCFNNAVKREVRVSGETGTWLIIEANDLLTVTGSTNDTMTIDGRPVFYRSPLKEIWKGHQMFFSGSGLSSQRTVLVHRNGILPYIPVTRRQYLAHCIKHVPEIIMTLSEGFIIEGDKERAEKMKKMVGPALKRYQDELKKSTTDNLLDSAAFVFEIHPLVETAGMPIFMTEGDGGKMLIIENPAYFRKDLPRHVPQLFIVYWTINPGAPGEFLRKSIEDYFPIEKLQAMIDK
jgi:hypothetical protein